MAMVECLGHTMHWSTMAEYLGLTSLQIDLWLEGVLAWVYYTLYSVLYTRQYKLNCPILDGSRLLE